jgi:hypothetical protein
MGRKIALVIGNSEYDDASLALVHFSLRCLYKDCPSPVAGSVTQTDVLLSAGYVFILRHGSLLMLTLQNHLHDPFVRHDNTAQLFCTDFAH